MRALLYLSSKKQGRVSGRDCGFLFWYCSVYIVYLYMLCIQWINNCRLLISIMLSDSNIIDMETFYHCRLIYSTINNHYYTPCCAFTVASSASAICLCNYTFAFFMDGDL